MKSTDFKQVHYNLKNTQYEGICCYARIQLRKLS